MSKKTTKKNIKVNKTANKPVEKTVVNVEVFEYHRVKFYNATRLFQHGLISDKTILNIFRDFIVIINKCDTSILTKVEKCMFLADPSMQMFEMDLINKTELLVNCGYNPEVEMELLDTSKINKDAVEKWHKAFVGDKNACGPLNHENLCERLRGCLTDKNVERENQFNDKKIENPNLIKDRKELTKEQINKIDQRVINCKSEVRLLSDIIKEDKLAKEKKNNSLWSKFKRFFCKKTEKQTVQKVNKTDILVSDAKVNENGHIIC